MMRKSSHHTPNLLDNLKAAPKRWYSIHIETKGVSHACGQSGIKDLVSLP